MARLLDGSYIPSYLQTGSQSNARIDAQYNNFTLRVGYVVRSYPPYSARNLSKKHWEYDVIAKHSDVATGAAGTTLYPNCRVMRSFGGVADFTSYTLRSTQDRADVVDYDEIGSNVFLLCADGNSSFAYIVGSPEHQLAQPDPAEHHYLFQFNGAKVYINQAGEFKIERHGPTNHMGGSLNPANQIFKMASDGSIFLSDRSGQSVVISPGELTLTSQDLVGVRSKRIELGSEELAPVLRATDSYQETAHDLASSLKDFLGGVRDLCSGILSDPVLSTAKGPASALLPMIVKLELAITQHDSTLSTKDAISTKTFSE